MLSILLIVLPALAALLVWLYKAQNTKHLALGAAFAVLGVVVFALTKFQVNAESQFSASLSWIKSMNINVAVGIDGISMILVLLTAVVTPLIIYANFDRKTENPALFYSLILFMEAALMGVFVAKDIFLFYFFFEVTLIPIYFLCAIWSGENRINVTFKFFVYTLFGSLFMLLALVFLYFQTPGTHSALISDLYKLNLEPNIQTFVFAAIFIAFAIKMPIFPFHSWQPDTYQEAPTAGSMLLSGIMLKMGSYGLIRILLPVTPFASAQWGWVVVILAVIGIIYGSVIAIMQNDMKRIIAFSSLAHVGLMAAGIFTKSFVGIQGALIQMFAHGINVVGLFFIAEIVARRTGTNNLNELGGITKNARYFTIAFIIIMLGSVALPMTNGFVGEFLLLKSLFDYNAWIAAIAGISIILGAVYMLRMVQKSMFGPDKPLTQNFRDLSTNELWALIPVVFLVIVFGVAPNFLLQLCEPAVNQLLTIINR